MHLIFGQIEQLGQTKILNLRFYFFHARRFAVGLFAIIFSLLLISPLHFLLVNSAEAGALHRLRFDHLSIDQGLPSTGVMTTYQTKNGLIWIGTANGLVRYDGRHMQLFTHLPGNPQSLSHSRVYSILEGQEKFLWIGTRHGVDRLNMETEQVERIAMPEEIEIGQSTVYAIIRADKDHLWLASASGLLKLHMASGKIIQWHDRGTKNVTLNGRVRAIISDRNGGAWFGQGTNLVHIDRNGEVLQRQDLNASQSLNHLNLTEKTIRSLGLDAEGQIWVGLTGGLMLWKVDSKNNLMMATLPDQFLLPKATITSILMDHEKAMWFALGNDQGLFRWKDSKKTLEHFVNLPSVSTSLSGNSLTSLMLDMSGSLWVGTSDYGVNLVDLNARGFSSYLSIPGDERSLSHSLVTAVLPDGNDYIWAGTLGGGLNRIRLVDGDTERIPHEIVGVDFIRTILKDDQQRLWIGGEGLQIYDRKSEKSHYVVEEHVLPAGARFNAMVQDAKGNVWVASTVGLYRISPDEKYQIYHANLTTPGSLNDDAIDSLLIDREKRLWVGTKGSLFLYDEKNDQFQIVGSKTKDVQEIKKLGVTALRQDYSGRIWAATMQGLVEVEPVKSSATQNQELTTSWRFVSWKNTPQIPNDVIEAMQDTKNGDIWMSSERGLMHINTKEKQGRNFPSRGRFEGAFNFSAAAKNDEGTLFFGGVGLISFSPESIWGNTIAPKVILSDILLFNQSLVQLNDDKPNQNAVHNESNPPVLDHQDKVDLQSIGIDGLLSNAKEIHLDFSQSMISFELSALHYYEAEQNRYAWKLEGYDKNWIIAQVARGVATYTNLDPGEYTLYARAANSDGVWGESKALLTVIVAPPFWRTWWWYFIWIFLVVTILIVAYKNRLHSIQKNERYLAHQIQEQTQEILNQKNRADTQRELAEHARNDIGKLSEIGLQITSSLEVQRILETLYQNIRLMIDASTIGVGIVDWENRQINFDYTMQGEQKVLPYARSLDALEQPATQCVLQSKELIVDDIAHDSCMLDSVMANKLGRTNTVLEDGSETENSRSGIYVPIAHGGRIIGVIGALSLQPYAYSQNELNILKTLATYTAVAYDNADTYRRLELAQSKLVEQEKMAALGSLVAGVAHELNTPIGNSLLTASTMSEVSAEFIKKVNTNQLRRSELDTFCETAHSSAQLLMRNLNNAADLVHSFKQIAVDQTSDKRRQFDLHLFCEEVVLTLSNRIKREGHILEIDMADGLIMDSYPGSLGQVLSNLIINAMLHGFENNKQGLITIQAKLLTPEIISLSVNDNGCGISKENLQRIFEPFFTTKLGSGGSGLGLHICYNIVTSILGGNIRAESEIGQGSTFILTFPLIAPIREANS